ncbi:MAG: ice-binding family protein, partial [Vicingaceae bacterium]
AVLDYTSVGGTIVPTAMADNISLRAQIAALPSTSTHAVGFLNETISAGSVIDVVGAASIGGNIDYDAGGNPNAIFVIRVTTTITAAALSTYTLSNGAQACNIFWVAGTTVALTGAATVVGNYMSGTTGAAAALSVINGRLLALAGTIVLTTVSNFTLPTGTSSLTMGVLNTFIVFSNAGAVTATAISPLNFTGDVGTGTAAGNTGWAGLNGNTYFGAAALGFIGSFVMALDGTPIESTRIEANGLRVSFLGKTVTTTAGGVISIMSDITLGTMTTGNRNIFSLRLN